MGMLPGSNKAASSAGSLLEVRTVQIWHCLTLLDFHQGFTNAAALLITVPLLQLDAQIYLLH